ncbi:MAG: hypothetical protein IKF68_03195 [Erysipelotrichaceae bacterium]|nr:hypothetical protein [Erysipelotrichaceae bacterium]
MEVFSGLYEVCRSLLPIIGVVVLIILAVVLIKIGRLLDTVNVTVEKTHGSIKLVEETLDKVQEPVDTVVKVSKSIDKAHDAGVKAIDDAKVYVNKNIETLKTKVGELSDRLTEKRTDTELKEPSPEDILKGE